MADNNEKKVAKKSDKPGFFSKAGKFFRDYRSELKKISWPTFSEVVKNTIVTLVTVLIVGIFIWIVDFGFSQVRNVLLDLSEKRQSADTQEIVGTDELDEALESIAGGIEVTGEEAEEAVEETVEEAAQD